MTHVSTETTETTETTKTAHHDPAAEHVDVGLWQALPVITRMAHWYWMHGKRRVSLEELLELGTHVYGELLEIGVETWRFYPLLQHVLGRAMQSRLATAVIMEQEAAPKETAS